MNLIKKYNLYNNIPAYLILIFPLFFILGVTFVEIVSLIVIFFFLDLQIKNFIKKIFSILIFSYFFIYI